MSQISCNFYLIHTRFLITVMVFPCINGSVLTVFPYDRNKKPLPSYLSRIKSIATDPLEVNFSNAIIFPYIQFYCFCLMSFRKPLNVLFILIRVKCTGAVNEYPVLLQCWPDISQDSFLPVAAERCILFRPLTYSDLTTEHSFSRAGGINEHNIEKSGNPAERRRITLCYNSI